MSTIEVTTKPCPHCKESSTLTVNLAALAAWKNGMVIQDAFPEMSADDRELLITGIHPDCWSEIFEDEDEDE